LKKALVFIEVRENQIKKSSIEALSAAIRYKGTAFSTVDAVLFASAQPDISQFTKVSPDTLTCYIHSSFSLYSPSAYKKELSALMTDGGYDVLFCSNTAMGRDLAPRIAAAVDCGLAMDLTELKWESDNFVATRPVFAGKALEDLQITTEKKVFTLRPNVFAVSESGENKTPEVKTVNVDTPDLSVAGTAVKKAAGKIDVAEANIIVSGGRGMKGPENYHLIESLAEAVGGAVGASRAVVDAGWRPHGEQVGQTGKTVSPSLYIACGISGAIQHLAGMSTSKYIVAINKDKDAPIFQIADYGITGDALELLPVMIDEIKKLKG